MLILPRKKASKMDQKSSENRRDVSFATPSLGYFFLLIFSLLCCGSMPVPVQISEYPRIFSVSDFLTEEECDYLTALSRPHLVSSKVIDETNKGEQFDQRRTSRGYFIPSNRRNQILMGIEMRIAAMIGMPIENGEDLHVLCYSVGGEYQPHYDYFNPQTPGGAECMRRGGQRVVSLIMYLNTPDAGGETVFPEANIAITPKKGDAVFFYNCTPNGSVDPKSLHGGSPVIAGEKWIATKWIREGVFR
jgi:prolyl 4-hydroxylase